VAVRHRGCRVESAPDTLLGVRIMTSVVCSRLTARPGREASVREAMHAVVPVSRAENGCEEYHAHQSTDDPSEFLCYERWRDEAAFHAHTQDPRFHAVG
jgi:quinol monooxygenase YgiN